MNKKKNIVTNPNLAEYCEKFANLNISNSSKKGKAPYKPVLLLSVIDLINQGVIKENQILVSDDLLDTFKKYWKVLSPNYKGGLHYPFFHLQNEGFWNLKLKPDFNGLQPKSTNKLKQAVEYATLDHELFDLIKNPHHRQELIDTLISVWFATSQKQLEDILDVNRSLNDASLEESDINIEDENLSPKFNWSKSLVRSAFFRKAVVHNYDYKCVFCQLKVTRSITQRIVDGAHIKPFAMFYDNSINNGISLCKNHHWAFDLGVFTITDQYKIMITDDLSEESPNNRPMQDFNGESILLPKSAQYFPSQAALKWHRENVFRK
ncbi:HNH endonuclease [Spirulina sp. CS-785/01]|uniref:HNH endonuclease n=1 Tax=Spirulina sp. CS-785/01 TaxID=3021716 RepID=UPI00232C1285|nr:HNH endonuclease [Spirulina sp. CS-785/01]MDB9313590.1 HNH endonuclease [Spirulina sp. CS-785/01]